MTNTERDHAADTIRINLLMASGLTRSQSQMVVDLEYHYAQQLTDLYLRTVMSAPEDIRQQLAMVISTVTKGVGQSALNTIKEVVEREIHGDRS